MKTFFSGNRRMFLKNAGILGSLSLLSLLGHRPPVYADIKHNVPKASAKGIGYRLTAHIKKYYETAGL